MAREKGRSRKEVKILMRVSREEKKLAEKLSKAEGMNTSEFFRTLLKERETGKSMTTSLNKIEYATGVLENIVAELRKKAN